MQDLVTKRCSRCERDLPADKLHYHRDCNKKDGLTSACRECSGVEFLEPKQLVKEGYKFCSKCGGEFPLTNEYFMPRKTGRDGFRNQCRKCRMEKQNQHTENNREIITNRRREYRQGNKPVLAQKAKESRQRNSDACKARKARYYAGHKGETQEYGRSYYLKNKELIDSKNRIYRSENRELCNTLGMRYRSKKKQLPSTLTTKQWNEMKSYFGNRCAYCNSELPLTREHFLPVNKGGEFTHNNIIPACKSCNSSKQDSDFFEWYPRRTFYSKSRELKILNYLNYDKNLHTQQLILF